MIGIIDFLLQCLVLALAIGLFIGINKIFNIYYYGCLPIGFTFLLCYCAVYALFEFIIGGAGKIVVLLLKIGFYGLIIIGAIYIIYWILVKLGKIDPIEK
ncbi:hypothetical protein WS9_008465 [Paraclostridium sordellii 8483]|uniref:hypothetical protein n=1 Tax=Paraclostridium sordellii TaxID=1505 RepID=UPI0002F2F6A3|nr:hypothetical protein [Paeniclostridium sordellii]TAN67425.1 hypothetical protein WS9_008465 [Paeniclostridium sordellii 8483]